jgi:hypothetical protein
VDPNDVEQVEKIMEQAARHRSVGKTDMNERSSRSHSVFCLHLKATNKQQGIVLKGTLSLVDLAGSERLDRSGATGEQLKETVAINKSLSSLADVFVAIGNKQGHIPFRNSKLTHMLQPALSGDGKTLMMVNLSPTMESFHESLCSLRLAKQINQCELGKPKKQVKEAASSSGPSNSFASSTASSKMAAGPSTGMSRTASSSSSSSAAASASSSSSSSESMPTSTPSKAASSSASGACTPAPPSTASRGVRTVAKQLSASLNTALPAAASAAATPQMLTASLGGRRPAPGTAASGSSTAGALKKMKK